MNRSTFLRTMIASALTVSSAAFAQSYPDKSKPIRLLFPFPVGTSTDVMARAIARGMLEGSGVNVFVESKAGGEGVIGAQAAKAAAPDGYTFFVTSLSTQVLNPHMLAALPYDPLADFTPLAGVALTPLMVNVSSSSNYKSMQDLLSAARQNPNKLTFGAGSTFIRLVTETLLKSAGIQALVVPYRNINDSLIAVAAGQIDVSLVDPSTAAPFYQKGIRPLATTGATRASAHQTVPTLKEGALPGFEAVGWFAAYVPAKTPPEVSAALQDMLQKALKTKYMQDVYSNFGLEPLNLVGEELAKFQRSEYEKWGQAVKAANLSPAK
ncbi:Bug family tripartite tricarboxylate transporter substrate binding protein [Variovorax saccharolyticus]|uniref:Bug family tripartite tricarboxylate transporter substrate binding protein n=1 Tax=Variovorax saccharolyticus TaxID=3053516 RepID=UPI002576C9F6|nr:tripartite tricarboxylate transporter substrate binding protein [Variovorax sp. J22R187]MDM0022217.1 tripartite tricarboxylate transporter substrate binding protein [Variovorax sp. J22R187]